LLTEFIEVIVELVLDAIERLAVVVVPTSRDETARAAFNESKTGDVFYSLRGGQEGYAEKLDLSYVRCEPVQVSTCSRPRLESAWLRHITADLARRCLSQSLPSSA
jgi:hypothetical protein